MELKYCECCGGLLLRRAGSGATYCSECAVLIGDLAPRRQRRRAEVAEPKGGPKQPPEGLSLEAAGWAASSQPQVRFAAMQWGAA